MQRAAQRTTSSSLRSGICRHAIRIKMISIRAVPARCAGCDRRLSRLEQILVIVSFIISTYNRREVLLNTLARIDGCGLARGDFETIVVDNASRDGTAAAVASRFPQVRLIQLRSNQGSCAKNHAITKARGEYIVFLDDDSFSSGDSIARLVRAF